MNDGYEYSVNVAPDTMISMAVTHVEIGPGGMPYRKEILRQVIDLRDEKTHLALVKLGWTPPTPPMPPAKCIVKGCQNHSDTGKFIGDLCAPCHHMLTTGQAYYTENFIGGLQRDSTQLQSIKSLLHSLLQEKQP